MKQLFITALLLVLGLSPASAVDSVVVFNEIQYHPPIDANTSEWIELHNQMAVDIDMSAWHIEGGIHFTFAEGTIIQGGGYRVVASNPVALGAATGLSNVLGPFTGSLGNAGEKLKLRDRNGRLMDQLTYNEGGKWPLAPDGSGAALAKRDPNTISDVAENWTSSVVLGGTPGTRNFPDSGPVSRSLIALNDPWRFEATGTDLGTGWKERDFNDSSWSGENGQSGTQLVSYWPFNGNATATRGTSGTSSDAVTAGSDRSGTSPGALSFSGATQYVTVPGGGGLNAATSGTISLWAKWNAATQDSDCCGTFGAVLARQGNGLFSDNILALSTANPATAKLVWRQSGGPAPILITGTTTVGTGWRHVAVTFSPTGSTLYLNGVAQGSATGGALSNDATVPLSIGAWAGDGRGFMNGSLDDVAVWDQPLTSALIAQLAASTLTPLDISGLGDGVYYSGDGMLAASDELRKTQLPKGRTTYYFRKTFLFSDNPARTRLSLDLAVDDGAVVYLNGLEVYRLNMPTGTVNYSTPASSMVGNAPLLTSITLPATSLVAGTNVLAVEVHQVQAPDPGMVFGGGLSAIVTPPGLDAAVPDSLVFNEVSAAGEGPLQVELVNRGAVALDTAGFLIRRTGLSPDAQFTLPVQMLAAGGFRVLNEATLGFGAVAGDKLFLVRPSLTAVADAVEIHARRRARSPDGTGEFLTPSAATFGAANTFFLHDAIVFNEIMYHAPPTLEVPVSGGNPAIPYSKNPEQWIELFNRSAQPVNLRGWRLAGGIDFLFATDTVIPGGGYRVVAKDSAALQAKFPGLIALGPYNNSLSGSGESLLLLDENDNPADTVHYYGDGRWPEAADGGGSSLELRDPRADNAAGENWAASNESNRAVWRTYTYEGVAAASSVGPDSQWKEFVIGLLDKGEVLLDDLSVIEAPATAPVPMLQNSSFTTGASKWRIIGNHHGTVVDDPDQPGNKVLRLVATGSTDHMSNHAETTLAGGRGVVNGRIYRITFRARWISGCRQLNTRLYFNRLARTTVLDGHSQYGTPGSMNTASEANVGPTYSQMKHAPPVPASQAPVTVSVVASDPDGIAALTLWSHVDGGAWSRQPMTSDGAELKQYSAVLPGRAPGTIVQFYVEGSDSQNVTSTFPAAGPNSRALYQVDDGLAKANGLHNMRLVALTADANVLHATINLMSNERIGFTVIYDEREVFYNVGLRLKGSEHSRTTSQRLGFNVGFNSEQLFRGVHRSVAIDRSESTGFGQREMLLHQVLNHCGGLPTKYHDLIQVITPRPQHTGAAELQLARFTDVFLDDQYERGGDGMVFEYELIYQLNSTDNGSPEGNKVPAPDSVVGTTIRNLGNDKEGYRWIFLIKNNEDRDDYSRLIPFSKWMATSGAAFTSQLPNVLDVDQWLRGHAVNVLSGAGDSYGGDGSQHNVQFYVRPNDGRMLFFPHDMDAFLDANRGILPNNNLAKIIALPVYARDYYGHLLDIIQTTYNSSYMTRWANHFGKLLPAQPFVSHLAFISQRRTVVLNAVNAAVPPSTPFAITTNAGNDTNTVSSTLLLAGTANLSVKSIQMNGVAYPITWTSRTAWTLTVPLTNGANVFRLQGMDRRGAPLDNAIATLTVTSTGTGAGAPLTVKINEWMASNAGPGGLADPADGHFDDWIELYNPNAATVDLTGFTLTDDLAQPAKWTFPAGAAIAPTGFLLVWADNEAAQNTPGDGLHATFQLSSSGETIGLYNATGVPQHIVRFGPQKENVSQGLFPDGNVSAVHTLDNGTPRHPNTLAGPMKIIDVSLAKGSFGLRWSAIPGRAYRVEYKNDLAASWTALVPDVPADGDTASATDNTAIGPRRFYRVRRLE
ncbi:MAG: hypothetical protein EXS36_14855 [Pedosphaera sp.]|nr:hypothetical protein [Pedosphaera sp.]